MTWKVRHEGSPVATEGQSEQQVLQGLLDGQWEPTDEVMGPDDTAWVALESHTRFAEAAADIEPPPPRVYDDETRLDMTPLIDVCMVLLIFFIIVAVYVSRQKIIEAANLTAERAGGAKVVKSEQVKQTMVRVSLRLAGDEVTVQVEKETYKVDRDVYERAAKEEDAKKLDEWLVTMLERFQAPPTKMRVLLDFDRKVPHAFTVAVQDAAARAHMDEVLFLVKPKK